MKFEDLTGDLVYDYVNKGLNGLVTGGYILHKIRFGHKEARSEIFLQMGIAVLSYNYGRLERELLADAKYGKYYGL